MEEKKLHIVMMPWLDMGHLKPFMELSKRIAQQGHKISYISTPKNFSRLPKIPPNLSHLIHPIEVYLPSIEKLPQNAETTIDLPEDLKTYLKKAYDGLEPQVSDFLFAKRPDWIIMDFAPHWITKLATKYRIPCTFLSLFNSAIMTFYGAPSVLRGLNGARSRLEDYTKKSDWVPFNTSIFYRDYEARELFAGALPEESDVSDAERLARAIEHCQVVAIHSSTDLEVKWLKLLGGLYNKPIIPIGFLPPLPDSNLSISWNDHMKEWSKAR
ncbi:hypothetical protein LUZ60_001723 [Juncus effusus]|nr:hypothetical protein LUZ60_001723 [Juncus effusus]